MNDIFQATYLTLQQSKNLLIKITNKQLCDDSVSPYYSSVGSHLRHILDFYDCVLNVNNNRVDLTARKRNSNVENDCNSAECYLNDILKRLNQINEADYKNLVVIDDLGLGKIEIGYTVSALLSQANSHTIHHYAIINYILNGLGIQIENENFGFNPTTPKNTTVNQ